MPTTATIAGTTVGTPTSNLSVGATGTNFLSWMSDVNGMLDANNYRKVFQKYGRGVILLRDVLRAKGQEMQGPAQDLNVIEETAWRRPIKLKSAHFRDRKIYLRIILTIFNASKTFRYRKRHDSYLLGFS